MGVDDGVAGGVIAVKTLPEKTLSRPQGLLLSDCRPVLLRLRQGRKHWRVRLATWKARGDEFCEIEVPPTLRGVELTCCVGRPFYE